MAYSNLNINKSYEDLRSNYIVFIDKAGEDIVTRIVFVGCEKIKDIFSYFSKVQVEEEYDEKSEELLASLGIDRTDKYEYIEIAYDEETIKKKVGQKKEGSFELELTRSDVDLILESIYRNIRSKLSEVNDEFRNVNKNTSKIEDYDIYDRDKEYFADLARQKELINAGLDPDSNSWDDNDWAHYKIEFDSYDPTENIEHTGHSVELLVTDEKLYELFNIGISFSENTEWESAYEFIHEYNVNCNLVDEFDIIEGKKLYDLSEYDYVIYSAISNTTKNRSRVYGVSKLYDRNKNELDSFDKLSSGLVASQEFLTETLKKFMEEKKSVKVAFVSSLGNEMKRIERRKESKDSYSKEEKDINKDKSCDEFNKFSSDNNIEVHFYKVSKGDYVSELRTVQSIAKDKLQSSL